jgi:hypothetical protein
MSVRIGDAPLNCEGVAELVDALGIAAGGSAFEVDSDGEAERCRDRTGGEPEAERHVDSTSPRRRFRM